MGELSIESGRAEGLALFDIFEAFLAAERVVGPVGVVFVDLTRLSGLLSPPAPGPSGSSSDGCQSKISRGRAPVPPGPAFWWANPNVGT